MVAHGDLRVGQPVALVAHEEGGAPSERVARYLVRLGLRLRLKDGVEVRARARVWGWGSGEGSGEGEGFGRVG